MPAHPADALRQFLFARRAPGWPLDVGAPVIDLFAGMSFLAELEALPAADVAAWQRGRIVGLLEHALRHSPGWRERLAGAAEGGALAFDRIPIAGRADLRRLAEADGPLPGAGGQGRVTQVATSGSTGVPLALYRDERAFQLTERLYLLDHFRHGRDPSRTIAVLDPRVHRPDTPDGCATITAAHPIECGRVHMRRSDLFAIADHLDWLSRLDAAYLMTHAGVVTGLLDTIEQGGPRVAFEQILTFGDTVDERLRQRARAVMGARIADRYSCNECGPLAFECPATEAAYHVAAANVLLEIVDREGRPCPPGVVGRVVVTALHSQASPIIRYAIGDLAAWGGPCGCGSALPVLVSLLGRERAALRRADGQRQFVRIVGADWLAVAPVREHRIIQTALDRLVGQAVADRPLSEAELAGLAAMLAERTGGHFRCEVVQVPAIDWGPSYKRLELVGLPE